MKLKTIFFTLAIASLVLSCNKARICKCTTIDSNGETSINNQTIGEDDGPLPGQASTKKNQETECQAKESSTSSYSTTCELLE